VMAEHRQRPGSAPAVNGRAKHVATSAVVRLVFPSGPSPSSFVASKRTRTVDECWWGTGVARVAEPKCGAEAH
jgi:hypothetical protein